MAVGDAPAPVLSTPNATTTSSVAVPLNGKRRRLYIENKSPDYDAWMTWGAAAVVGQGRKIGAGGGSVEFELEVDDTWAKDAVHVIADGGTAALSIEELSQ